MSEREENRPRSLPAATGQQMSLEKRRSDAPARASGGARPSHASHESRLIPLSIAGLVCFMSAVVLGGGAWYLFGTHEGTLTERARQVTQLSPSPEATTSATSAPPAQASPQASPRLEQAESSLPAPAGELAVAGGEVALGGDESGEPLRREVVAPFRIAETEVTNEQYQEFVKATGHAAPAFWKNGEFPPGAANEPVTNVSWQDATDYCRWLSERLKTEVRLPTEAEWELAARGTDNRKYPWGNEWDERAADSLESRGRVRAVRSFPAGKSPVGAYDMAGNVWEWILDEARDERGELKRKDGTTLRVIKGGSANEPRLFVNARARYEVPSNFKGSQWIGFRYVVRRGGDEAGR